MITLRVEKGPLQGQVFQIPNEGKTIIGRSSICDVALVDFKLSRIHCQIEFSEGAARLEDLGSRNGTWVKGERITAPMLIADGDRFAIGDTQILIDETLDMPEGKPKKVGQSTFIKTRETCSDCGAVIPMRDISQELAKQVKGTWFCRHCLDPLVDTEFSGYRVESKLGEGAMGSVYRGVRIEDEKEVALKFLSKTVTSNPDAVKRFLREAVSGGTLDHPNIVKTFESGVDIDREIYFLAMEYVEGTNARNLITDKGHLNPQQCLSIGLQIAKALTAAHESGVIHRDIKPANILVSSGGRAKLVDLGTAKSMQSAGLGSLTQTGIGMGTIAYMPPEQIEDAKHADHRSDQYSLGASLYHMLTGERPFSGKTPGEYFKAIRFQGVSWPDNPPVPDAVKVLVETTMEKDPEDRFQDPEEVVRTMEEILAKI
ncbi:MAG: protein kinase domain-containing protein [Planctomycetota bacterium]|jgi:pSer/pThr/pTyr-binding forkhead associated (FHA) protein